MLENLPALATVPQFCEFAQLSVPTAARMRAEGTGPQFIRLGRSVRYRREAVLAWLEDLQREGS